VLGRGARCGCASPPPPSPSPLAPSRGIRQCHTPQRPARSSTTPQPSTPCPTAAPERRSSAPLPRALGAAPGALGAGKSSLGRRGTAPARAYRHAYPNSCCGSRAAVHPCPPWRGATAGDSELWAQHRQSRSPRTLPSGGALDHLDVAGFAGCARRRRWRFSASADAERRGGAVGDERQNLNELGARAPVRHQVRIAGPRDEVPVRVHGGHGNPMRDSTIRPAGCQRWKSSRAKANGARARPAPRPAGRARARAIPAWPAPPARAARVLRNRGSVQAIRVAPTGLARADR